MEEGMLTKLKMTTTIDVLDGDSEGKDRDLSLQEGLSSHISFQPLIPQMPMFFTCN